MKPLNLRLRGFKGIKKGMDLDEFTLDLSGISGLVALAGENGRGKSTILENLHAYRSLFSRSGSLNQHCYLRDSEKDFTFQHEGHTYRTLLKIDAESERGEGFIWKDGESQVNGKRKEYDAYIENLLGSEFLFQNSVFCAQNSRKLTDLRTGELREMFAEFLRLDRLQGYEATCKQIIGIQGGMLQQTENRIAALNERLLAQTGLQGTADGYERTIAEILAKKQEIEKRIEHARTAIETLRERVTANQIHIQRYADIEVTIRNLYSERAGLIRDEEKELNELRVKYAAAKIEHDEAVNILKNRDEIEGAAKRVDLVTAELAEFNESLSERMGRIAEHQGFINEKQTYIAALQQQIRDHDNNPEMMRIDREIARVTGRLGNKYDQTKAFADMDPECKSTTCSFIVAALQAEKELPFIEEEKSCLEKQRMAIIGSIAGSKTKIRESIGAATTEMQAWAGKLQDIKARADETRKRITVLNSELASLKFMATRLPEIQVATLRVNALSLQASELTEKGKTAKAAWEKRLADKHAQIEVQEAALAKTAGMVDGRAEETLKSALEGFKIDETAIDAVGKQIDVQRQSLAGIRAELASLQMVEKEIETVSGERARFSAEISDWTYLRNACSKTGLQALEIDGVIPAITYDANRLLSMTFGPSYSVRIQTQDDDGREVFQIWCIRDDGDETLLDNLSGGQKVWILKALRLSLTLLSKHKSGRNFKAAFADEEDGALDINNAQTFVALYRSFMQAGEFESFFYISHKAECRNTADHIITFRKGGVEVR